MKGTPLKNILLDHLNKMPDWQSKGSMYVVAEREGFSPESAGRKLRELAEEGLILVDYYKSKRNVDLARYARIGEPAPKLKSRMIERNGIMYLVGVN